MAINLNAASASALSSVVDAKSPSVFPPNRRHSNLSFALSSPNLKVNLHGLVLKGSSIRKSLVKEAKSSHASAMVVGTSKQTALGGWLSVAKYCTKHLPSSIEVLSIHNGKAVFRRSSNDQVTGRDPKPIFLKFQHFISSENQSEYAYSEMSEAEDVRDSRFGLGTVPIEQVDNKSLIEAHRVVERERLSKKLDKHLQFCTQNGVKARLIYIKMDSIPDGIVKLIHDKKIGKLVMGAAADKRLSKLDDPVMWGFKGFPTTDAKLARWALAAEDICFKNIVFSYLF